MSYNIKRNNAQIQKNLQLFYQKIILTSVGLTTTKR